MRSTLILLALVACGAACSRRPAPSAGPPDAAPETYSFSPFYDCSTFVVPTIPLLGEEGNAPTAPWGREDAPVPPRVPTWASQSAFVDSMVASVSLDPPSDAGRAAAMDALHRGPNGSGAGGDRAFLFSAVPLSLIAARVARARVTFTVTSEKKIDRVNVRLVDPLGDGGLTPGKDWAARALAGEACALGEIDGVAAGTRVSFVFDRAAAGYDAGTTRDDAPVPNTGDARDPFGGPISLFGLGGFGDAGTNTHAPQIRMEAVSVNGRLPPEVIVRIVRQNFGRFRLCYQHGLDASPALKGRVAVKFVIGADGSVTSVSGGGSDMPDPGVVGCVTAGFRNLSFPAPEGGVVSVVFPLVFTPPS